MMKLHHNAPSYPRVPAGFGKTSLADGTDFEVQRQGQKTVENRGILPSQPPCQSERRLLDDPRADSSR